MRFSIKQEFTHEKFIVTEKMFSLHLFRCNRAGKTGREIAYADDVVICIVSTSDVKPEIIHMRYFVLSQI